MTVKDLIKKLKSFDQELHVVIPAGKYNMWNEGIFGIEIVEGIDDEGQVIYKEDVDFDDEDEVEDYNYKIENCGGKAIRIW